MQSRAARRSSRPHTGPKDFVLKVDPRLVPPRLMHALAAAASLAVSGCVTQDDTRSYTYEYTDRSRLAAERRATQDMQDSCYFSGALYFKPVGPPQIVSEGEATDRHFRATQSFYCVGTQGGP